MHHSNTKHAIRTLATVDRLVFAELDRNFREVVALASTLQRNRRQQTLDQEQNSLADEIEKKRLQTVFA